jgi:hypothetical protein
VEKVRRTPPLEEKELTKIFLKTLDQFYYENMVASAPNNFAKMVTMGMRLIVQKLIRKNLLPFEDFEFEYAS